MPIFLYTNPEILATLLEPTLRFMESGLYQNLYVPHDLGKRIITRSKWTVLLTTRLQANILLPRGLVLKLRINHWKVKIPLRFNIYWKLTRTRRIFQHADYGFGCCSFVREWESAE
jgi:hypothetical protein